MSKEQTPYISLLVIDDHNMIVNGIRLLIGSWFRDFYQANNAAGGIELAIGHQPQLVIVDQSLPDSTGDAVVREIRCRCPSTRILAYSFNSNAAAIIKLFEAGVHGYVIKSEDDAEFERAVTTLLEGKDYFCKEARAYIVNRIFPEEDRPALIIANTGFSAKEVEIIRLICRQMTAREISKEVYLSERTVEQYRSNITRRIGAKNVAGVIKFALQHGIITLEDL